MLGLQLFLVGVVLQFEELVVSRGRSVIEKRSIEAVGASLRKQDSNAIVCLQEQTQVLGGPHVEGPNRIVDASLWSACPAWTSNASCELKAIGAPGR